jgi:hypothetical protein
MFKSYHYINVPNYHRLPKYKSQRVIVYDSDFQYEIVQNGVGGSLNGILDAVVRVYEHKKLRVVPNIFLYFRYLSSWGKTSMPTWIALYRKSVADHELWDKFYAKYGSEFDKNIEKYMVLL